MLAPTFAPEPLGRIVKRRPTEEEAARLVTAIQGSPYISGYTRGEWRKWTVMLAEGDGGELMGGALNDDFARGWTEVAVLFVLPEFRGRGLGRQLFEASSRDIAARDRHLLIMSNNPAVIAIMHDHRLDVRPSLEELPEPYRRHRFTLTTYYTLRWSACLYRLRETARKRRVFGRMPPYTYGLRLAPPAAAR